MALPRYGKFFAFLFCATHLQAILSWCILETSLNLMNYFLSPLIILDTAEVETPTCRAASDKGIPYSLTSLQAIILRASGQIGDGFRS
jgi:hypothetical protein